MDAIVLAGGRGVRLGGRDKASLVLGGMTFLELALAAVTAAERIVVVGPRRRLATPVVWAREKPPGGGPVAALDAGLRHVTAERVAVVAVDLPFLRREHLEMLSRAAAGREGAIFVDEHGHDQPLAGVYTSAALRRALDRLPQASGASMRTVVQDLDLARVAGTEWVRDCDTQDDIAAMGVE
jgi:molybdopterin-guanine dinucleotide biosynthesis protein A